MQQLLQNAVYGTALILVAALLRRVLKDKLAPEARLALWAVCLFRLLTPAAPESVFSLWGLVGQEAQSAPVPAVAAPNGAGTAVPAASNLTAPAPAPVGTGIPWEMILLGIWLAVGAVLGARYVLAYVRTRRAVSHAIPLGRDDPRYAPLPKCARLREGAMDGAPLTFGAVRPTVVLSPGLSGEVLECVLAHEGVHASRRDNLWHYAAALALTVFWWNPAVWLMARLLRQDVELSCDRAALKKLGAGRRADYANALVSMATAAEGPAFCQTFGRKAAEERIRSVMKYKKMTVIGAALSLALVLGLTAGFASNPVEQKADDTVEYHGRTYNRADLSQETLDWLDWYLALPEEEQLAISMVPPELIDAADVEEIDAAKEAIDAKMQELMDEIQKYQQDEMSGQATRLLFDNGKLTRFTITMDDLAEDLSVQVRKGALTQAEADQVLAQAAAIAQNGVLDWAFDGDCGLTAESTGKNSEAVCYRDGDGNPVHASLSDIVRLFILPAANAPIGEPGLTYDPKVEDSAGTGGEPISPDLVCPVEGCTVSGSHTIHCNGFHSGGVCDGSCAAYSLAVQTAGSGQGQGNGYGHHGSGHHSEGHHGGHH